MKECLLFKKPNISNNFFPAQPINPDHVELALIGNEGDFSGKNRVPLNTTDLMTSSTFDLGTGIGSLQGGNNKRLNYGTILPEPGTSEFTIECYVYFVGGFGNYNFLYGKGDGIDANQYCAFAIANSTSNCRYSIWPKGNIGASQKDYIPSNINLNNLYHLVWGRQNRETDSQYLMFVNGVLNGNTSTIAKTDALLTGGNVAFTIGDRLPGSIYGQYPINGYLLGFRYTLGECIYTTDFTS